MNFNKRLLLLLLIPVFALLIFKSNFFVIRKVSVQTKEVSCVMNEALTAELSLLGQNILFLDDKKITEKIKEKYLCLEDIKLERRFPGEIKLLVSGRVPLTRVVTYQQTPGLDLSSSDASPSSQSALIDWSSLSFASPQFLADKKGVLFALSSDENFPLFFVPEQTVKLSQRLDAGLFEKVFLIFNGLNKEGIKVQEAKLVDQDLLIYNPQKIAFSLKKDVNRQLISLQLILQKATIDDRKMELIDLRFNKPIVVYNPKK